MESREIFGFFPKNEPDECQRKSYNKKGSNESEKRRLSPPIIELEFCKIENNKKIVEPPGSLVKWRNGIQISHVSCSVSLHMIKRDVPIERWMANRSKLYLADVSSMLVGTKSVLMNTIDESIKFTDLYITSPPIPLVDAKGKRKRPRCWYVLQFVTTLFEKTDVSVYTNTFQTKNMVSYSQPFRIYSTKIKRELSISHVYPIKFRCDAAKKPSEKIKVAGENLGYRIRNISARLVLKDGQTGKVDRVRALRIESVQDNGMIICGIEPPEELFKEQSSPTIVREYLEITKSSTMISAGAIEWCLMTVS